MTQEQFDSRVSEIEDLQKQVADILHNKHWWVRWFRLGKAQELHSQVESKFRDLLLELSIDLLEEKCLT